MYKKVLYNIKKIKKNVEGEGDGQYLNPKHPLCISMYAGTRIAQSVARLASD